MILINEDDNLRFKDITKAIWYLTENIYKLCYFIFKIVIHINNVISIFAPIIVILWLIYKIHRYHKYIKHWTRQRIKVSGILTELGNYLQLCSCISAIYISSKTKMDFSVLRIWTSSNRAYQRVLEMIYTALVVVP